MTPKEKAEELFYKMLKQSFSDESVSALHRAKQCVLLAVDEILHELDHTPILDDDYCEWKINYWNEVKDEIEKL